MIREEEMRQAVEEEHGALLPRESFITLTAMEWADKTMIDKACEWLMHNVNRYINDEGAGYFRIEKTLFDHFRKAMEE